MSADAKRYAKTKITYAIAELLLGFAFLFVMAAWGSARLYAGASALLVNGWLATTGYVIAFFFVYRILVLPLAYMSRFRLEHRYGLSRQSLGAWAVRQAKVFLVGQAILIPAVLVVYALLAVAGDAWWLFASATYVALAVVVGKLFPVLIVPLFYETREFSRPALAGRLAALAREANFAVSRVCSFDLGRETRKAAAALVGLGANRQVLVSDTLLDSFDDDEVAVVVAHELGHHVKSHYLRLFLFDSAATLMGFAVAHYLASWAVGVFGITTAAGLPPLADVRTFPVLCLVVAGFALLVRPLLNYYSRQLELESDRYALKVTRNREAYVRAFEKLARQNLVDTSPGRLAEILFHDHPSIETRIELARQVAPQAEVTRHAANPTTH